MMYARWRELLELEETASATVIVTVSLSVNVPSSARSCRTYVPASEKVAVVSIALASPKVTLPGPESFDHVVVGVVSPPVTVPSSVAVAGSVIDWSMPASVLGGFGGVAEALTMTSMLTRERRAFWLVGSGYERKGVAASIDALERRAFWLVGETIASIDALVRRPAIYDVTFIPASMPFTVEIVHPLPDGSASRMSHWFL